MAESLLSRLRTRVRVAMRAPPGTIVMPSAGRAGAETGLPSEFDGATIEYNPSLDGDADPGEIVWAWVGYEEDPTQGKDRPVVVIGRRDGHLIGVPLTSKQHEREPQVSVGTGSWDHAGRVSYARLDRLFELDERRVRREGAILDRARFDAVVDGVRAQHARH